MLIAISRRRSFFLSAANSYIITYPLRASQIIKRGKFNRTSYRLTSTGSKISLTRKHFLPSCNFLHHNISVENILEINKSKCPSLRLIREIQILSQKLSYETYPSFQAHQAIKPKLHFVYWRRNLYRSATNRAYIFCKLCNNNPDARILTTFIQLLRLFYLSFSIESPTIRIQTDAFQSVSSRSCKVLTSFFICQLYRYTGRFKEGL